MGATAKLIFQEQTRLKVLHPMTWMNGAGLTSMLADCHRSFIQGRCLNRPWASEWTLLPQRCRYVHSANNAATNVNIWCDKPLTVCLNLGWGPACLVAGRVQTVPASSRDLPKLAVEKAPKASWKSFALQPSTRVSRKSVVVQRMRMCMAICATTFNASCSFQFNYF